MIDVENEIFTAVKTALVAEFPSITVESVSTYSPSKFPFASIEEADNYSLESTRDTASNENHAIVMYAVNAYSNKKIGKKEECKKIVAIIDGVLNDFGFTRISRTPINLDNATIYRIAARYRAVVSKDKTIYRR